MIFLVMPFPAGAGGLPHVASSYGKALAYAEHHTGDGLVAWHVWKQDVDGSGASLVVSVKPRDTSHRPVAQLDHVKLCGHCNEMPAMEVVGERSRLACVCGAAAPFHPDPTTRLHLWNLFATAIRES